MNKELDLSAFSYLASARVLIINEYPKPNYGTEVIDVIDTLAADAPMVAVAASRLGLKVGLIANNIGLDATGEEIMSYFKRNDIKTKFTQQSELKTPFIVVLSDKEGNREWFPYIPNAIRDLGQARLDILAQSSLAYIDYYEMIQKLSQRALDFVSQNSIPSLINLGGTPFTPEIADKLRKRNVAIVQTNLDEREAQNAISLAQGIFVSVQPDVTIVTLGGKGAVAFTGQEAIAVPAYDVPVRHVHGAGAAFSAGFTYCYLKGFHTEDSLRFACALGSLNCTVERGFDAFSPDNVEKFISEQNR